jgi:hypothetical protein
MAVLAKDQMKVAFAVQITFNIDPNKVKDFVEHYSTLQDKDHNGENVVKVAYNNFLKERLRTFAREEVQQHKGAETNANIALISNVVSKKVSDLTKETPFVVQSVVVGNIQLPHEVTDAVSSAQSASIILQRKETEVEQAKMDAKKREAEAMGIKMAMEEIKKGLTPEYIQYEAIQAQKMMIGSPNHTTIYIPVGPMGIPLVGNLSSPEKAGK